jgi:uncharacterized protein YdhG (YjbR/CyaY superfamily)
MSKKELPADEREAIRDELSEITERVRKQLKVTIPEAKHEVSEIYTTV